MKIVCIADTQLAAPVIKKYLFVSHHLLNQADKIIHLGDGIIQAQPYLNKYPETVYIRGNHDQVNNKNILKELKLTIGGFRFLFIHGERKNKVKEQLNIWQNKLRWMFRLPPKLKSYYQELYQRYQGKYEVVTFGHIHIPRIDLVEDRVFFCPGGFPPKRLLFGSLPSLGLISFQESKKELVFSTFFVDIKRKKLFKTSEANHYDSLT